MIKERITEIADPAPPTRFEVSKCIEGSRNYRLRMANSIRGEPIPTLKERMAAELLRAWDEVERLRDIQSELIEEIEHLHGLKKRGSNG